MGGLEKISSEFAIVIDAAERRARELLAEASKYDGLGQPKVAKETYEEHYKPLRNAIDTVKAGVRS